MMWGIDLKNFCFSADLWEIRSGVRRVGATFGKLPPKSLTFTKIDVSRHSENISHWNLVCELFDTCLNQNRDLFLVSINFVLKIDVPTENILCARRMDQKMV